MSHVYSIVKIIYYLGKNKNMDVVYFWKNLKRQEIFMSFISDQFEWELSHSDY